MSFIDKLEQVIHLEYVLKALGVITLALAFFFAWHQVHLFVRIGFIIGPIMWFVGAHFDKIYK